MKQRIEVGTSVNPEDYQTTIVEAAIQLEPSGDWYKVRAIKYGCLYFFPQWLLPI